MCARDDCFRRCSGDIDGGLDEVGGAGNAPGPAVSEEDVECE